MAKSKYRIEKDTLGEVKVPRTALFGAQTQRAINNFGDFGHPFPSIFIKALVAIKITCAQANVKLGLLENDIGRAIEKAGDEIFSWSDEKISEQEEKFLDELIRMLNLTEDQVKQYIRWIGNRRLIQLGLEPIYQIDKNPLTWLDTMLNAVEHMNFFEGRATEYSKASTKGTWAEAFS